MMENRQHTKRNKIALTFKDSKLEDTYREYYNESIKVPLRFGIIISILSWFSGIPLIYIIIPEHFLFLGLFTFLYIGSYFGFIIYATYKNRFSPYLHLLGAVSNAWAGLFLIYFCDFFPQGETLILPALIFIVFFGLYMVRLRWLAAFIAVLSYTIAYQVYISVYSASPSDQVLFNSFVAWMTLIFVVFAGRVAESNNRLAFLQRRTIRQQSELIEKEKESLLKEVHHRVQNNLQLIVSLINLQLSKIDGKKDSEVLKNTQNRILSMSLVHQRMKQASNFSRITLNGYTTELMDNLTNFHNRQNVNYKLNIPNSIVVDVDQAIPLGLILNEIGTNFFKHCKASVDINFNISCTETNGMIHLRYEDNGEAFPNDIAAQSKDSLGLELISILTEQIDGDFKFYSEVGAVIDLSFPLKTSQD